MKNLKDQLAGIAALVAAVVAIGGGFATYGKLTEKINVLESKSSADYSAQIAVLEEKVAALQNADTSHEHDNEHGHTKILVNEKQIELLGIQIEEIKVSTSNPLAN
jgi:outer membrane murein-binding lipoprotein Lpp